MVTKALKKSNGVICMDKKSKIISLSLFFLLVTSTQAKTLDKMYNARYCEVIMGQGEGDPLNLSVYNTFSYSNCPQKDWNKLSLSQLQKQHPSDVIMLNGPRYFMMDRAVITSKMPEDIRKFGRLTMQLAGKLRLSKSDDLPRKPYTESVVDRNTRWLFSKGRRVYELRSPDQKRYIMQSYSNQIKKQTPRSLESLGKALRLPKGWKFRTYILDKDLAVSTNNGKAYVVQDDLRNTYQRVD